MRRHHNLEERLYIVSRIIEGEPITRICRENGLDHHDVQQWFLRYKKYGEDGLRGTRSLHYSSIEKLKIAEEFIKEGVPLQELCLRYDLSRSTIKAWVRKVHRGLSLNNRRRRRLPKDMARPKKNEPQTELERLQAENLRLRAELALLKKVKALVEEEEARARLNGQKPSTN